MTIRLALTRWEMAAAPSAAIAGPDDPQFAELDWLDVEVPCTAAGALRSAGRWIEGDALDIDGVDWWFRTRFVAAEASPAIIRFGGVATIAEIWCNDAVVHRSESMFVAFDVAVSLQTENHLVVVCRSLTSHIARRRPRPRWKTRLVDQQQLRWVRTSLTGRMPSFPPSAAPVGLWRPVEVIVEPAAHLVSWAARPSLDDDGNGVVSFVGTVNDHHTPAKLVGASLIVGNQSTVLSVEREADGNLTVQGSLVIDEPPRWWPATSGRPTLLTMAARWEFADTSVEVVALGRTGFRSVSADTTADGFRLSVNGVPMFCRGACWVPPDTVNLSSPPEVLRATLDHAVVAGMNMLRVTGTTVYEQDAFYDLCDEVGIMIWHDFMFANFDYPIDDDGFASSVNSEVAQFLRKMAHHPCIAVLCGGSEIEQQAAMMGLDQASSANALGTQVLPALVDEHLPAVPYVRGSPSGGVFPFSVSSGISHYFGVGAYLRPLDDARRSGVRFATECLAFSNVPCRQTVETLMNGGEQPGTSPRWKQRVPRDRGAGWDFEDVRDFYVKSLFGVDPAEVRYADPDRYLDLGRAAVCVAMETAFAEWRRPDSRCNGALVFTLRDQWPGAGWGLLDAFGIPKSALHAIARSCAPVAVVVTDEGLDGLSAHLLNDRAEAFNGSLRTRLFGNQGTELGANEVAVSIPGHGAMTRSIDATFEGFRDLTYSYRFGPLTYEVVSVQLLDAKGVLVSDACFVPSAYQRGQRRANNLQATACFTEDAAVVTVCSSTFAEFVSVDLPGYQPDTDWFHIAPGDSRTVTCRRTTKSPGRYGEVRAINMYSARTILDSTEAAE